jgi:hypothetical protein
MPGTNYNAPQYGVKFELNRSGIARCTFNDPTDADNVGSLTAIDGLDSPEVREQGENLQEFDGGIHADRFFYGRRTVTLEGVIHGHASIAQRNDMIQKLMDATNAMRDDVQVIWTPSGGIPVYMLMRRQQPLRVEGLGFNKTFTITFVAADPRIYSQDLHQQSLTIPLFSNLGSTDTFPTYVVTGTTTANSRLTINGKYVASFSAGLKPDFVYYIDSRLRTVQKSARFMFRRNSFPNPSFEKLSGNQYVAVNGAVTTFTPAAAQPTPFSTYGNRVASVVVNGSSGFAGFELLNPDGSGYWTNPYLAKLALGFSVMGAHAIPACWKFVHYNSSNTIVATDIRTDGVNVPVGSWAPRVLSNYTNLAFGSVKSKIYIGVMNDGVTAPSGDTFYFDGVDLEFNPTTSAGDFHEPGTSNWVWEGTANDSSSIVVPPGFPSGSADYTGAYDALDLTHTDWAGMPPGNSNLLSMSNQGVGASAYAIWRDAWM